MAWRVPRGGKTWEETKGERARLAMKELVESGRAQGVLAFEDDRAIGWCSIGPRSHFPRLERVKAYRRDDTDGVWSVNCFFIPRANRGKGLSRILLEAAVAASRVHGARALEGYPATLTKGGARLPAAFAWMGPLPIFERLGFSTVQATPPSKPLVRLALG
jgi:GNAT superfamily N-acetyltransferase